MTAAEYSILFALVAIMGGGVPGPGEAALIAAGTLAGEGRLSLLVVLAISLGAWMLGSITGYAIGYRGGRRLLDRPGRFEESRLKLLTKGDRLFGRHNFTASVVLPAFVSGIFMVKFWIFIAGAAVAGTFFIGIYVMLSYYLGAEAAERIGTAGSRAAFGVLVVVTAGLGIKVGLSKWRKSRQARSA